MQLSTSKVRWCQSAAISPPSNETRKDSGPDSSPSTSVANNPKPICAASSASKASALYSAQLSLLYRRLDIAGFAPRLAYTMTRNRSNIGLYSFNRNRFEIGLTSSF